MSNSLRNHWRTSYSMHIVVGCAKYRMVAHFIRKIKDKVIAIAEQAIWSAIAILR